MPRNDDGEFELVLGNKQLLSIFFIVIVLMGISFAMGYIIARNSGPAGGPGGTVTAKQEGSPIIVEPDGVIGREAPAGPAAASASPLADAQTAPVELPAGRPVTSPPAPAAAAAAKEPAAEEAKPVVVEQLEVAEPAPGQTFLQVLAVGKADAELAVATLAKKGFRATVAPGPTPSLFRVLVGPFKEKDTELLTRTRTDLETVGFKSPIVRKY